MPGVGRDAPGARRGVTAVRLVRSSAVLLLVVLILEIVRANLSAATRDEWPWRLRLLGVPTTAALLTALVIALLARDQYARSVAPVLRYVSQWVAATEGVTASARRYRQVLLRNAGPGTAVVVSVVWRVGDAAQRDVTDVTSVDALREVLGRLRLSDGDDYTISNYSPGTALAPGEQRLYFECTADAVDRLAVFEAVFEYESLLGDTYVKAISLLPHPGASEAVTTPSAIAAA
jgi:hypothetical protein